MEKLYSCNNMHCAACKANIENELKKVDGVVEVEANVITSSVKVLTNKDINDEILIKSCKNIGYNLEIINDDEILNLNKDDKSKSLLIKIFIGLILLIPLIYLGMGSMYPNAIPGFIKSPIYIGEYIQLALALIIIEIFFNYYKDGFMALIKLTPNMDSLVFLGSLFSLIYSLYINISHTINSNISYNHVHLYYDSAAMILVIVTIGKYIELLSKRKAKTTINELLKLRPKTAHLLKDNKIEDIETKYLKLNDIIIVNPGEVIPSDGIIISGKSSVDESIISGESLPIYKEDDDHVIGGSLNIDGTLKIKINKDKKDNVLSKIISLVMEASNMNNKLTRKIDLIAKYFVPVILSLGLLTFILWISIPSNHDFNQAFSFAVSVIVVSCPCALGLATPISLLVGSSVFAKQGILVNNSEAIEKLKDVNVLVLDKTNTITNGELDVEKSQIFTKSLQILDEIFTLEKYSTHPLAQGIVKYLNKSNISNDFISNGIEPGKGVFANFKERKIYVGNIKYLLDINKNVDEKVLKDIDKETKNGLLPLIAFNENEIFAIFYLKDKLKLNAKEFINEAKKYFKRIILLTGDNSIIANQIASECNITEVISEVLPNEKSNIIKSLQEEGNKVMMIGDGVNDSIALNLSDVGVGIAKGSDVALASSDFILMRSNLMDIIKLIKISKRIRFNISLNLFWAFIYNIIFIPIAAGAFASLNFTLSPMICSMLMALSSVTVCLNALTLFINKSK